MLVTLTLLVVAECGMTSIVSAPTALAQQNATSTPAVVLPEPDPTSCNCWSYLQTRIKDLPLMNQVKPNSTPVVGGVVILDYHGVPHVAYIEALEDDGVLVSESNYKHCTYDKRVISWTDKALVGYYTN